MSRWRSSGTGTGREEDARVKERLLAMLHLYDGKTISETSQVVKRSERSIGREIQIVRSVLLSTTYSSSECPLGAPLLL